MTGDIVHLHLSAFYEVLRLLDFEPLVQGLGGISGQLLCTPCEIAFAHPEIAGHLVEVAHFFDMVQKVADDFVRVHARRVFYEQRNSSLVVDFSFISIYECFVNIIHDKNRLAS